MQRTPASAWRPCGSRLALAAAAVWSVAVAAGFAVLWKYKTTPGHEEIATPIEWPVDAALARSPRRATLLMFAHPKCTCTRASIAELAQLMTRVHDRLDSAVLFLAPRDEGTVWTASELWASAARIPGVRVIRDEEGREATRFGVMTSGGVVLYDGRGRLLFKGGITPARGHEGDSFGRERIVSLLTTGAADRADAPAFGCALKGDEPRRLAQIAAPIGNQGEQR